MRYQTLYLFHLEIPDNISVQSLGFLDDVCPKPTPLSPKTEALRDEVVRSVKELGVIEFADKPSLTYTSIYAKSPVNCDFLDSWADLNGGWRCMVPKLTDPVWLMLEYGMHRIPLIYFEYGLRLPMYPFHLAVYEALGCGITQLTPNSIAQMSGFVARCAELRRIPTLRLFFFHYGIKHASGQIYFDKRLGRSRIVNVRSSNSGYHGKWLYFHGPDLEFIKPCGKVSKEAIDRLTKMEKYDNDFLDNFQGQSSLYDHTHLKNAKFLEEHNRNIYWVFLRPVSII